MIQLYIMNRRGSDAGALRIRRVVFVRHMRVHVDGAEIGHMIAVSLALFLTAP